MNKLLAAYNRELGICDRDLMSLEDLIDSHRRLRESNKIYLTRWREEVNNSVNNLLKMEIDDQYVRWDELEKMTLAGIVSRMRRRWSG